MYERTPTFVPPRSKIMGLRASARSMPAPAWAISCVVEVAHRLVQPRGPGVQDVVVAQGDAVYAGLIQYRHQPEVAREGRRVGVVDGISYDGVLEVRERKVSAREVFPDRARIPGAFGGELVDDPRLRVGALLGHPARDGRVASIEREVYPHPPPDDHVVLPAVEHDVAAHDHAPQLLWVGNRRTFRLQGIAFRTSLRGRGATCRQPTAP